MHRLELAVDEMQPVQQPVWRHRLVMAPQAVAAEAAQVMTETEEAVGVEADYREVAIGPQDPMHFAQGRMGVFLEFKGVERHEQIDAAAFQRQFIPVAAHGHGLRAAIGDEQPMVDRAVCDQVSAGQGAGLEHMIAEGAVQQWIQALTERRAQLISALALIPGFQPLENLVRLYIDVGFHGNEGSEGHELAQCRQQETVTVCLNPGYRATIPALSKTMTTTIPVIEPVAAFSDNYIWLLRDGQTAHVVDPGDAQPVLSALKSRSLTLGTIVLTHHHFDHVGGVQTLKEETGCRVIGPDNPQIEGIDTTVTDGDDIDVGSYRFRVMAVPGHTLDHIAYFSAATDEGAPPLLFCGDTLFAAGCGRLFEGDPPTMYRSLQRIADLPGSTRVYCAHEYTLANLAFARAADPENTALLAREREAVAIRERGQPTVPSTLELELATNPFLRSAEEGPQQALQAAGHDPGTTPVDTFAALRAWKDTF